MSDLYLTDEEIWGKEPTWEQEEIKRLNEIIEKLKQEKEDLEDRIKELEEMNENN